MRVADGRVLDCSPEQHPDLFPATIGGMGLTGHILEVEFGMRRIPSQWIWQESRRIHDIDEFQDALEESAPEWPYTMGWIDCLARGKNMGRGILMTGRWAEADQAPARAAQAGFPAEPSLRLAVLGPQRPHDPALQRALLSQAMAPALERDRQPRVVLLSARRDRLLEPHVRPARVHAVSVRAAARGGSKLGAARARGPHRARRSFVLVRHQRLRA